jgi:hypothetical protein
MIREKVTRIYVEENGIGSIGDIIPVILWTN